MSTSQLDDLCINTIRLLAVDAVQQANSGHPGAPMGMAPMAYVLWGRFLKHNPADPKWPDRDRFLLSAGHASALLYALLHLTGYDLPLDEIKRFRQWGSKTPGHPEYRTTPGVEATTGMLGQGFANGVGMAIAERWLAECYNRPGHDIIDHYTYGLVSDGDLQEGISSEAASLAGKLCLGKLVYLYDDNGISIEGSTDLSFTEDVGKRFEACGWHVVGPLDGMDPQAVEEGIKAAQGEKERPSLVICQTVIGYGSPNRAGIAKAHGEALGEEEVRLTKENLGWQYNEPFSVPQEAEEHLRKAIGRGKEKQRDWESRLEAYRQTYPEDYEELVRDLEGRLPEGWDQGLSGFFCGQDKPLSTRKASGQVMTALAPKIRALAGGSADLGPSVKTIIESIGDFDCGSYSGRNLHFGVREHAMAGTSNGLALHGGMIPYTSTFLVFYDYMRPAVRMAALMGVRVIFVFSHDSVGVGEDGPTHQPVEQVLGLRSVPNLVTIRPADAAETAEAWKIALERADGPTALILTRQDVPVLERPVTTAADGVRRGGYILWEASSSPEILLISTGSEVHIALEAGKLLQRKNIPARVVSLPSWELFDSQPVEYRNKVLPPNVLVRVSVEAATPLGWEHYIGASGKAIGVTGFGASAPWKVIYQQLGLTAERVADEAMQVRSVQEGAISNADRPFF